LYGWGFGFYYQLAQPEENEDHEVPVKIKVGKDEERPVKKISCGYFHSGVIM